MTIRVDDCVWGKKRVKRAHMTGDSKEELVEFAESIGVKRCWFHSSPFPHYDVNEAQRKKAIRHGAVPVTSRQLVVAWRLFH